MQSGLELGDLLLIAEAVLGEPAERLQHTISLSRLQPALIAPFASVGGVDLYPDPVERAAICCSRLVRSHPFPCKNEQIAYLCMRELLERADVSWAPSRQGAHEVADAIRALEAGKLSEEQFVARVRSQVSLEERG